jgi:hypothetical protein
MAVMPSLLLLLWAWVALSSSNSTGNKFVDELSRIVSGIVLEDVNSDRDSKAPIAATTVLLVDFSGVAIVMTVVGSTGMFAFVGAQPGVYAVVKMSNPDCVDVIDSDGGDPNVIAVDVSTRDSPGIFFLDEELLSMAPSLSVGPSVSPSGLLSLSR